MNSVIEWHDPKVLLPIPYKEGIDKEYYSTDELLVVVKKPRFLEDTQEEEVTIVRARIVPYHPLYNYRDGRWWFVWHGYWEEWVLRWAFLPENPLKLL